MLECVTSGLCVRTVRHRTLRETIVYLHWAEQQPGVKSGGLRHLGGMQERVYYGRNFDTVDQLKQMIMLQWLALQRRFIDRITEISFAVIVVDENGRHIEHTFH